MDINHYIDKHPGVPECVMRDMRQRFDCEENDTTLDEKILTLSGRDFLEEYLTWNGFIGFTDMIIEAIYMAYGLSLEDEPFDGDMERKVEKWEV